MRTTTPAVVLRRVRWSESSLILTLYSIDLGRISAIAKGALRPGSRFHGSLELFGFLEATITLREGRELETLVEASVIDPGGSLRGDPLAFAHACLIAEWVTGLLEGPESSAEVYHLLSRVFAMLPAARSKWAVTCAAVECLLRLSGLGMEVDRCTRCGEPSPGAAGWTHAGGGLVCPGCRAVDDIEVAPGVLEFIRTCRRTGIDGAARTGLWKGGYRSCHDLMRDFAQAHNQSGLRLRSLAVLEDLEDGKC